MPRKMVASGLVKSPFPNFSSRFLNVLALLYLASICFVIALPRSNPSSKLLETSDSIGFSRRDDEPPPVYGARHTDFLMGTGADAPPPGYDESDGVPTYEQTANYQIPELRARVADANTRHPKARTEERTEGETTGQEWTYRTSGYNIEVTLDEEHTRAPGKRVYGTKVSKKDGAITPVLVSAITALEGQIWTMLLGRTPENKYISGPMDLFWTKGECDQPEWWAMVPITLPLSNALEGKQVAKENLILRTLDVFKGLAYMKGSKLAHFSVSLETVVGKPEAKSWLGNKLKLPKVQLDGFHWTSDVKSYTFNDEQKPNIEHYRSPEMRSLGEGDSSANDVYAATILALHILVGWEQRDNVRRLSDKINANAASMYNRDPPEDPPSAKDTLVGALHTHKWGLSDKMIDLLGRGLAYAPHQGLGGDGRAEIEDLIAEWEKTPEYEKAAKK